MHHSFAALSREHREHREHKSGSAATHLFSVSSVSSVVEKALLLPAVLRLSDTIFGLIPEFIDYFLSLSSNVIQCAQGNFERGFINIKKGAVERVDNAFFLIAAA